MINNRIKIDRITDYDNTRQICRFQPNAKSQGLSLSVLLATPGDFFATKLIKTNWKLERKTKILDELPFRITVSCHYQKLFHNT